MSEMHKKMLRERAEAQARSNPISSLNQKPMGMIDRVKSAAKVLMTGKTPTPLSDPPEDKSRAALVTELNDWVVDERKFWKPIFERIRQEQKFAAGSQWINKKKQAQDIEDYIGDVIQQMKNRKTAALYAKNPMPQAILRDRLEFKVWDGNQQTIENCDALIKQLQPVAAQAHAAEQSGQVVPPPSPEIQEQLSKAQEILNDYNQGMSRKAMRKRVAETGEKLIKQQWDAQSPDMIVMGKQAVTRIITGRVAYIKVLYRRDEESVPTESINTADYQDKLATLQAQIAELKANVENQDDAARYESEVMKGDIEKQIAEMKERGETPTDEGIVLDWLSSTSVIVDRRCKCLKEFVGAHRIAHEIMMTVGECEAKFKVSLKDSGARIYTEGDNGWTSEDRTDYENDDKAANKQKRRDQKVCVWRIEDKDTGLAYYVCDGVKDFLCEPEGNTPEVNRFWTIVAITFNAQEVETNIPDDDVTIYPRSDIRLAMPMQIDINIAGQEKRDHLAANRVYWLGVKSKFASTAGVSDLDKLSRPRQAHDVFMLENLNPGEKISDFLQRGPYEPIQPGEYDSSQSMNALMLATGMQASDLGEQRPDEKATGQNIAAQAMQTSLESNIDDLDFAFSTVAQMCWQMLIMEMPEATVIQKVGIGAVWPQVNLEQIAEAIFFVIEAGSMGRPNQQQQLQKFQVLTPALMEMLKLMNRSPEPLLKLGLKVWDANIDLDQLLADTQIQAPPPAQPEPQKPPSASISVNYKDLPPEEQAEASQKFYGLKPAPPQEHLINKVGFKEAVKAHHENTLHQQANAHKKLDPANPQHVAIARGFLKLAKGDPAGARALAQQHGYS